MQCTALFFPAVTPSLCMTPALPLAWKQTLYTSLIPGLRVDPGSCYYINPLIGKLLLLSWRRRGGVGIVFGSSKLLRAIFEIMSKIRLFI